MPLLNTGRAGVGRERGSEARWCPLVRSVSPAIAGETASPLSVLVHWTNPRAGRESEIVDLSPVLGAFKAFRRLVEDRALFQTARLSDDGREIIWNDGSELAVSTLVRLANEQMSNADFREFLAEMRFTFDSASAALGLSRRLIAYYAADRPVPRHVALACRGFAASIDADMRN